MPLRSPGTTVARTDAEIVEAVEDSAVALAAGSTVGGTAIASTDDVRTDAEIVAAVEASATLDLDAGATIGGSGIVSDADLALVALDDLADVSAGSPTDQDVLTWDDGTSTWVAQAAGGGLTGISILSGSDYVGFTPNTNGHDLLLEPNDLGALRRSTLGGLRGNVAVCLSRPTGPFYDQIASGIASIAIGKAKASHLSSIAIGQDAVGTANYAIGLGTASAIATNAIAIGRIAYASGTESIAIGDDAHAEAVDAIAIGTDAKATRTSSIVLSATGADSKPLTRDSTRINGLYHVVNLKASSADATPVEATSNGAAASTTDNAARNMVVLADDKVIGFTLCMTAIQATTNDAAMYEIVGAAKCIAGTASIIGTNTTVAKEDDAGWDCTVTCTSNRLVVTCTADAGGASTWRGTLTLTYED